VARLRGALLADRVLVDPTGAIVTTVAGEGHRDELEQAIASLLEQHGQRGTLAAAPLALTPDAAVRSPRGSRSRQGAGRPRRGRLFVADTAHHRIVVASWPDEAGRASLLRVIGAARRAARRPGDDRHVPGPQGLALARGRLFVADTENHLVRAVDLATWEVSTWAGTGEMTYDFAGGARGTAQGVNSPWDLAVHGSRLLVAMAGTHQVWRFELGNALGRAYAGTGREDLEDGRPSAPLAQPSGLAVAGDTLWIATAR